MFIYIVFNIIIKMCSILHIFQATGWVFLLCFLLLLGRFGKTHCCTIVQPFVFSTDPAAPYATWPPRNPSSEPDFHALNLLPAGLLDEVTETEEYEEVFFDADISENTMPPKTPPHPAQMYLDYKDLITAWDRYYALAVQLGDDLPSDTMEDLTKRSKAVDKAALDIQKL